MQLRLLNSPNLLPLIPLSPLCISSLPFPSSPKSPISPTRRTSGPSLSTSALDKLTSVPRCLPLSVQDDDYVVGDCLVFEDGAFEDPFAQTELNQRIEKPKRPAPVQAEDLVPEEWKRVQAEINLTKKDKRRIAHKLQYGSRIERKKGVRLPDMEEYKENRAMKLSQLNPVTLDKPLDPLVNGRVVDQSDGEDGDGSICTSSGRVAPKNPRETEIVAKGSLQDIKQLFSSDDYEPGNSSGKQTEGRQKLFTKEEKALLNKRTPDLADATSNKWMPLHTVAASGEFYLVDKLLKHNVYVNAVSKDGLTALHRAILCKKQAVTNYLLRESANPLVRDKEGATLIHYAVQAASTEAIKILLLYNVDINLPDEDGWTPLHLAVQTRRTDVVRLLLIKGADKELKNQNGLTPLDLCLHSGRDMRTYELIKLLKQLPKTR